MRRLRDEACSDQGCQWCHSYHNPVSELNRLFGFEAFRPEPKEPDTDRPMQQAIVEAAMKSQDVLAILPTGTGKSLCYQIPALSRYYKTGALTVVLSPLVALMGRSGRRPQEPRHHVLCHRERAAVHAGAGRGA